MSMQHLHVQAPLLLPSVLIGCTAQALALISLLDSVKRCAWQSQWLVYCLWVLAEIAIAATDLAEIIGSAVALNLLFNIPLYAGVIITAVDVLFIIAFGMKNFRFLEVRQCFCMLAALVAHTTFCCATKFAGPHMRIQQETDGPALSRRFCNSHAAATQ